MKQKPKRTGLKRAPRSQKEAVRKALKDALEHSPEFLVRLVGKERAASLSEPSFTPRYRHD